MVSLDLVIDSQWGDIENKKTQHVWLNALPSGYIVAMLSGSPCCTWSSARGKQYEHTKIPRLAAAVALVYSVISQHYGAIILSPFVRNGNFMMVIFC